MREVGYILGMGFLTSGAVMDIQYRSIPGWMLLIEGIMVLIYRVLFTEGSIYIWAAGGVVGFVFLFVSRWTREGIGYADSITIFLLGIFLGIWELLAVLGTAFLLSGLTAMLCMVVKHWSRKKTMPFLPFLAAAYLITWAAAGIR